MSPTERVRLLIPYQSVSEIEKLLHSNAISEIARKYNVNLLQKPVLEKIVKYLTDDSENATRTLYELPVELSKNGVQTPRLRNLLQDVMSYLINDMKGIHPVFTKVHTILNAVSLPSIKRHWHVTLNEQNADGKTLLDYYDQDKDEVIYAFLYANGARRSESLESKKGQKSKNDKPNPFATSKS
jgi:hypothetical protein